MFDFKKGNILKDCSEAIINTVNCVGVMGRGIALQFKQTYPDNYKAYKSACDKGEVKLGKMFIYSLESLFNPKYIINFPTKNHWKEKSSLKSIELGLLDLKKTIIEYKIKSIAIPPLGCGLGGLNWKEVKSLIAKTFDDLKTVDFIIYEPSEQTVTIKSEVIPELTSSRAALIELINRYLQSMLDPFITLLEIHKLMYFLQESGQPLKLNYSKAIYGPYAENLRHVLFRLSGHYIGGYDGEDSPSKNITLSPNAIDKANQLIKSDCELLSKLDKVSNLVNGFETPYGLELLSTVHWVVSKEYKSTINEVVDAVYAWNPQKKKFSQRQIEIAFNTLKSQNWLSNIDTHQPHIVLHCNNIAKTPLDQWIYLLRNSAVKADFNAKGIKEAEKALNIMKMTKEERAAYDRYIDESRLSDSLIKTAETKGEKRGIAIGKEEGIVEGISIGEKRGDARGIRNLIETLRGVSVSEPVIIEKLQQKYGLTPEEAQQYLNS